MSDKPSFLRSLPFGSFEIDYVERQWRCRRESLLAVDEGVERIVAALRRAGRLDDTLIVFTSDNGYLLGEHRLPDEKLNVYEESVRVPLALRGPGIPAGGACRPGGERRPCADDPRRGGRGSGLEMDGRSLLPVARRPRRHTDRPILLENLVAPLRAPLHAVHGGPLPRLPYVEYENGERELYFLQRDPRQLRTSCGRVLRQGAIRSRASAAPLRDCRGRACRARFRSSSQLLSRARIPASRLRRE